MLFTMNLALIFPEKLPLKKARAVSVINTAAELARLTPTTLILPEGSGTKKELEAFYGTHLSALNLLYLKANFWKIKSSKIFNFFLKKHLKHFDLFYVRHLKVANFLITHKLPHQKVIFEAHEVFYESLKEEAPLKRAKIEKLKRLEEEVYAKVDAIVFTNETLKNYFCQKFSIACKPTSVVRHAVKNIPPFVKKDFSQIEEIYYCGSFYRWKGI